MGISWKEFFIGVGVIALSFALPGPVAAHWYSTLLLNVGFTVTSGALADKSIEAQSQGALIQSLATTNDIPIVYGTARVAGKLVWADAIGVSGGISNEWLWYVSCLCLGNRVPQAGEGADPFNGEIQGIGAVYLGDTKAFGADDIALAGGEFASGNLFLRTNVARYLGAHDQTASPGMIEVHGDPPPPYRDEVSRWPWTEDHRLQGIAYMILQVNNADMIATDGGFFGIGAEGPQGHFPPGSGVPNATAMVKGRRLYDPRTGYWTRDPSRFDLLIPAGYNDNWALCVRDYMLDERSGCALALELLDETSFMDMADVSEEIVTDAQISPFERRRFTCNGVVDTSQATLRNLQQLLSTGNGFLTWEGGQFRLKRMDEANALHDLELNEHNIIGDWELASDGPEEWTNLVIANYVNGSSYDADTPDDHVAQVQHPLESGISAVLDDDGGFLMPREIELPFVNNEGQAYSIALEHYTRARNTLSVALTAKEEALALSLFDRIRLTHQTVGMEDKVFYVLGMGLNPDETVRLALKEEENGAGFVVGGTAPPEGDEAYPRFDVGAFCEIDHGYDLGLSNSFGTSGTDVTWYEFPLEDEEHTDYQIEFAWSNACLNFDPLFGNPHPGFDCGRSGGHISATPNGEWRHSHTGFGSGTICSPKECDPENSTGNHYFKARWRWRNSIGSEVKGPWSLIVLDIDDLPIMTPRSAKWQAASLFRDSPAFLEDPMYCVP